MNKLEFSNFEPLDYACTEAINTLCTNLSFAGDGIVKIMVTSSQSSEGKSFLAMNMMRTMSELGKTVVLVDADLRRSFIASTFGVRPAKMPGLTHYLVGMSDAEGVLYETDIEGAYMVPVGRAAANSLSLLNTPRLTRLLDWLAKQFDVVLVDVPPIGVIIDAAEIAKSCDGTLLVVSWNRVSRRELNESKRQIERAGCRVLGTVLNNVFFDSIGSKKYYNRYYRSYYTPRGEQQGMKRPRGKKGEEADMPNMAQVDQIKIK
ncbi:MAG: CpsD/CapB family tyrosine-protein kinase [Clostridia bacterium]|nr:CpsD/CapB family tyrosine-protein kinase [Clostridia bacterium]